MFLGNDGKIKITEIPKVIMSTEVGQWGTYLRYRPSYYTLRVLETALWRDNAFLWYLSRYLMLVVSMWLGWRILTTYFPKIVSYLFVFYVMTMPFWPDLLTRLGPSETYAVPAILLFTYGLITNRLWMISLGYVICIGAKENFLFLFPIILGWAGYKAYFKNLTKRELVWVIILTLYTFFILGAILVATSRAGADIYGTKISYRYRITKLLWDIPKITKNKNLFMAAILIGLSAILSIWHGMKQGLTKMITSPIFAHVGLIIILIIVIATQYIFYINLLPSNMRYDFPALLLFPIIDLIVMRLIIVFFARYKYGNIVKLSTYGLILLICTFYIFHTGYTRMQLQSKKNVAITQNFEGQLNMVSKVIKDNPEATIFFISKHYIDYEAIASVSRFLASKNISNKFYLLYTSSRSIDDPMELEDRLIGVMYGELGTDGAFDRFTKYTKPSPPCLSIVFGSALPLPECPQIGKF